MISFVTPPALLLLIPLVALTVFAGRRGYANLSQRRLRLALAARLAILVALILALAGTHVRLSQSHQAAVFVADLSASDAGQRSAIQALINDAAARRPGGDAMGVVSVGRQPVVEQPVTAMTGFDGFQSTVDPQHTNLAGGLDLANALLPGSYQHRVVLVSDGQQNVGDALVAARLLRSQGVQVDVAPVHVPGGAEVRVDRVEVPSQLRPHESFPLVVRVHSTVATATGLTILRDGSLIGSRQEQIRPGDNRFTFEQSPLTPGFHTYKVEITPAIDTQPENNQGSAFTTVQSTPKVLVIAGQPREAVNVMASLKSTGIQADLQTPTQVIPDLAYLQKYAGVVIVDTSADVLGSRVISQLVPYVRDLGHGLVVIGGQNAYSMGGYGQTPLEQVLPVSMDLPKQQHVPTTAVALVIESLEENTQINISKQAGKAILNLLTPQDQVAISDAPLDSSPGWVVPLQHVTNKSAVEAAIDRMAPGDPESYAPILQSAYETLRHTSARVKHIILLGDGDAEDPSYQQLVERIHAAGITVSTVSTNGLGRNDFQTMADIAHWGGGRYYRADDPSKIPQIFLRETRTAARLGIVEGKFYPQELSANPMVRDVRAVAPLFGYVATTPKPAGEIVLASAKLDPVLAGWQYGLGRSVAWTSDASGLWSKDWLRAPGANRFWANLVSWVFPSTGTGHLFIATSSSSGQGHISVSTPSSLGPNPNVTAHVLAPGLQTSTLQLEPSAPGQFAGSFPEGAQGVYFVTVESHGAGHADAGQVGMDVPYSPEYRTTGLNMPFLRSLAAAGGGTVITRPDDAWSNNLPPALAQYDIAPWLLILAILLLPLDVAIRRLVVSRRELASIAAALPFRRSSPPAGEPALAPLGALRARRAQRVAITPRSVANDAGGVTTPRRMMSSVQGRPSAPPASSIRPPSGASSIVPPDSGPDEDTTASRLLAARRKKR